MTVSNNLIGSSSIGKSTALKVVASVYGGHDYIQQWQQTGQVLIRGYCKKELKLWGYVISDMDYVTQFRHCEFTR